MLYGTKRLQRHRQNTLARTNCSRKIPHPKGEKMHMRHLFTFLYAHVSVKACALGKLKSKPFTSQPLPFRAYCHSSLSANTHQTLAVAWG